MKNTTLKPSVGMRNALIDELRGLAIINMIGFHACYDLVYIFGFDWTWYKSPGAGIWQEYIGISFLFIAGISSKYSKGPYNRAFMVAACAALLTIVTRLTMPSQVIWFGVLHCLAVCMLVYAIFANLFRKIPAGLGFIIAIALVIITWGTVSGNWLGNALPEAWYDTKYLMPLGFVYPGFYSSDYFPLLPYFFVFLAGVFSAGWVKRMPSALQKVHIRPLAFLGRHSLIIYMLHQPIIYGILMMIL